MLMYFYDFHSKEFTGIDDVPEDINLPDDYPATEKSPPKADPYCVVVFDTAKGEWAQQMKPIGECFKEIEGAIDEHIAETVAAKGYTSVDSLAKYFFSSNAEFKADAEDATNWVTAVWDRAHELQDQFIAGTLPIMTPEQIIDELPELEWRYPPREA